MPCQCRNTLLSLSQADAQLSSALADVVLTSRMMSTPLSLSSLPRPGTSSSLPPPPPYTPTTIAAFGVKGKETRTRAQDLPSPPSSSAAQTSSERVSTSLRPRRRAHPAGPQRGSRATMWPCYTDRRYYANSNKFLLWLNTEYKTLIHIPISYNIFIYYIWLDILNPPALCMSAKDWKQLK